MTQTFAKLKITTTKAMALKLGRPKLALKAQLRLPASLSARAPVLLSPAYAISLDMPTLLNTIAGSIGGLLAPIASPAFTGIPTAPTAAALTNSTQLATTAYADAATSTLSGAVAAALALKAPLASPAFTGVPTVPTAAPATNTTQAASTEFVLANSSAGGAGFEALAFNNTMLNGGMEIDQERAGASSTATNATYALDNWIMGKVGTMVCTVQQVADAPVGLTNSLKVTVGTAEAALGTTDALYVYQALEGFRTSRYGFGAANALSVTLGFWVKIHRTGSYSGALRNAATNRSYPFSFTQNVADTWEYKTVTITGDVAGAWVQNTNATSWYVTFTMAAGTALCGAAAAWAASNLLGVTGTTNGVAAITDIFQITGVTAIAGTTAPTAAQSVLLKRSFDQELMLCKRYFNSSWDYGTAVGTAWSAMLDQYKFSHPASTFSSTWSIPPMRVAPTLTFYDNTGAAGFVTWFDTASHSGGTINTSNARQNEVYLQHIITGAIFTNFGFKLDARL